MNVPGNAMLQISVKIAHTPVKRPVLTVKMMRRLMIRSLLRNPERLLCRSRQSATAMIASVAAETALIPCMKSVLGWSWANSVYPCATP